MSISQVQRVRKEKIESKQVSENTAPSTEEIKSFEQGVRRSFDELEKLSEKLQVSSFDLLYMTLKSEAIPPDTDPVELFCRVFPEKCKSA